MKKRPKEKLKKSSRLNNVCYEIRGPVLKRAREMEEAGKRIIKLNIGNPAMFGFEVPEEIQEDVMRNAIQIVRVYSSHVKRLCTIRNVSVLKA